MKSKKAIIFGPYTQPSFRRRFQSRRNCMLPRLGDVVLLAPRPRRNGSYCVLNISKKETEAPRRAYDAQVIKKCIVQLRSKLTVVVDSPRTFFVIPRPVLENQPRQFLEPPRFVACRQLWRNCGSALLRGGRRKTAPRGVGNMSPCGGG